MNTYQPLTRDKVNSIFGAGMHEASKFSAGNPTILKEDVQTLVKNGRDSLEKGILNALVCAQINRTNLHQKHYKPYNNLMGLVLSIKCVFYDYEKKIARKLLQEVAMNETERKNIRDNYVLHKGKEIRTRARLGVVKVIKNHIKNYSSVSEVIKYLNFKEMKLEEVKNK